MDLIPSFIITGGMTTGEEKTSGKSKRIHYLKVETSNGVPPYCPPFVKSGLNWKT